MSIVNTIPVKQVAAAVKFHIVIPARYESQRLPGKPLLDVCGKSLIQRVYECSLLAKAASVTVATDDQRIYAAVKAFGGEVFMTKTTHSCGTSRLAEIVDLLELADDEIIVNVQGDEPLIPEAMINLVATELANAEVAQVATLATPIKDRKEIFDPHIVKVVLTANNNALLFSRAPIPWHRDILADDFSTAALDKVKIKNTFYLRHVGLYAYRCETLRHFNKLTQSPLEVIERLEQLRFLWHGKQIKVAVVEQGLPIGVDTKHDLAKVREIFA